MWRILRTVFIFSLVLAGCGKFVKKYGRHSGPGTTQVSFGTSRQGLGLFSTLNGGIMIYAQRVGAESYSGSAYLPDDSAQLVWTLPNGVYRFIAFGYDGNFSSSGTTVRCASGGEHVLSGESRIIQLVFDYSSCGDSSLFQPTASDSGSSHQPYDMLMVGCHSSAGNLNLVTTTASNNVCDGVAGRPYSSTTIESFNFSIPEYDNFDGDLYVSNKGQKIETGCLNFPDSYSTGSHSTTNIKLLPGGPNSPFVYGFNMFSQNGCVGNKALTGFVHGFSSVANGNLKFFSTPSAGTETEVGASADPMVKQISGGTASTWNWFFFREHNL